MTLDYNKPFDVEKLWGCFLCPVTPDGYFGWESKYHRVFLAHMAKKHGLSLKKIRECKGKKRLHLTAESFTRTFAEWYLPDGRRFAATETTLSQKQPKPRPKKRPSPRGKSGPRRRARAAPK